MSEIRKTIVHVIAQLRMGAGRVVTDTAIEQACGLHHEVMVCVSTNTDAYWRSDDSLIAELTAYHIPVHTIGDFFHRQPKWIHQSAAALGALIYGRHAPVIVHAHTAMAAAVGGWVHPHALVATCHGWGMGRPAEFDLQDTIAYQLCDSVLTYSTYWADRLKSDMAVRNPMLIPMGLNLARLTIPFKERSQSRPLRIGTACELIPRKGVDLLLEAMPPVWAEKSDAELHIIGDGESAQSLRNLALQIDPGGKRILFHGAQPNPIQQLADLDLFVLASRSDNFPVVLLEAMCSGIPIVATDVGGIPQMITSAACGVVVPPESADPISSGILRFARMPREEMVQTGIRGHNYVKQENDVRKTTRGLDAIYHSAIQKRA